MFSKKQKAYLKLNLVSVLFAVVSLISVTLAWFAYSGLVDVETEVGIKAWYIEFEKNNEATANDIIISLANIYPGMDTVKEVIKIKNLGDADAKIKYTINEARILEGPEDFYEISDSMTSEYIEDALSHKYPFHINISISKKYVAPKEEDATFEVSVSWPLDSGDDILDSYWGNKAYKYEKKQNELHNEDASYVKQPAIKVAINVVAEQAIDDLNSVDSDFLQGNEVLYDISLNKRCYTLSDTCLKTHVIDSNNLISDEYVNLLVENDLGYGTYNEYLNMNNIYNVTTKKISATDILKNISRDIESSVIKVDNISDLIVGNVVYQNRANQVLEKIVSSNGYVEYSNAFGYLSSNDCVWTSDSYNSNAFAYKNIDTYKVKLYGEDVNASCRMIPIIVALKENL